MVPPRRLIRAMWGVRPCVIDDVGGFTRRTTVEELVQRHDRHRGRSKSATNSPTQPQKSTTHSRLHTTPNQKTHYLHTN